MSQVPLFAFKITGLVAFALGASWVVYAALAGDTVLRRYYGRYTSHLDRQLRLLFLPGSGKKIFIVQLIVAAVLVAAALLVRFPYFLLALPLVALGPIVHLRERRHRYVKELESQTDGFILGLANALKTVPSPGAALEASVNVLPQPMRQEIERMLKEIRVGSTLEQALVNMSSRLKSTEIDAALSSLLIGLQVGGNLPQVLEGTASTIREMARLRGVVRTKTADSRIQLWVLAFFPFAICYGFVWLDPEYFKPLETTFIGNLIAAITAVMWLASLITARKVLKVDL